jgi:hypothetical protein
MSKSKFDLERFDLKKLDELEIKEKYQVENLKHICNFREFR